MEKDSKICQTYSLKLYPEEIERFKRLSSEMDGVTTTRGALCALMDFFENPKTIEVPDPELIRKNEELQNQITMLKEQLETALSDNNASAMSAQSIQLELEKAQEEIASLKEQAQHKSIRPENVYEVEVHPVPNYFLRKMAKYLSEKKKTEITPGYVLVDLFVKDLQNPRSNNLPYVVSSSEIEKVLNEYKKAHPEEYQENQ